MPVKNLATAIVIALAGNSCVAAPGMMHSTAAAPQTGPGFWSKLWRGDDAPQTATPTPTSVGSTTDAQEKSWWAPLTAGRLTSAFDASDRTEAQASVPAQTPADLSAKGWVVKAQLAEMQQDYAAARHCFSQALTKSPNDPATLREIGHFEDRREELALAEQMYRRALASTPNDPALLNDLALCCARQGRLEESAGLLNHAIALRPEKTLYRNNIAKVLIELGQHDAAATHLAAAHPAGVSRYNLGQLLAAKGDANAAANCFREAVRLDPSLSAAVDALRAVAPDASVQVAAAPQDLQRDPAPVSQWQAQPQEPNTAAAGETRQISSDAFPRLLPPVRE